MKDVTGDVFKKYSRDKFHEPYKSEKGYAFTVMDCEITIPQKLLSVMEAKTRLYEVEDIADLQRNYRSLLKQSFIPPQLLKCAVQGLISMRKSEELRSSLDEYFRFEHEEFTELTSTQPSSALRMNLNHCSIDNVCLGNFSFTKRQFFELCEFDVIDTYQNSLRGIFVYYYFFVPPENEAAQQELRKVLAASETTRFDLDFSAMPEQYSRGRKKQQRGRKIKVHRIHKSGEKIKEREDIPSGNSARTPVLEPVFVG
ncbi:MAG: hypothetical protein V1743_03240 [Nanoarchaeota archaeon]